MLEHIATLAYAQIHDGYLALKKELGTDKPCHLGQKRGTADAKLTLPEAKRQGERGLPGPAMPL